MLVERLCIPAPFAVGGADIRATGGDVIEAPVGGEEELVNPPGRAVAGRAGGGGPGGSDPEDGTPTTAWPTPPLCEPA